MLFKLKKIKRVAHSYLKSKFVPTPIFLRIIPSDKCNLACKYCFQYDNTSHSMTKEEFDAYFDKAVELGTGIISFLGGEPMLWPHIYYAIEKCSQKGIITEMSTNATFLSEQNLEKLGKADLDMLNISVDSLTAVDQSNKSFLTKNDLVPRLESFRKKYRTHVRLNAVITKANITQVECLIDFAHEIGYPISLGFVVPPLIKKENYPGAHILFGKGDFPVLESTVNMVLGKKKKGHLIIDPDSYFEGIFDFINGTNDWDCKFAKNNFGGIAIAPDGRLRSCPKLMDYMNFKFLDLTPDKIREVRTVVSKIIDKCNIPCYSNCGYAAYYYTRHKYEFFTKQLLPSIKHLFN